MSNVFLTPSFLRSLTSLSSSDQSRVGKAVERLAKGEIGPGMRLQEPVKGTMNCYKFRVSDGLRVIYTIYRETLTLLYSGQHDEAYSWATKHRVVANQDVLEIIPATLRDEPQSDTTKEKLYGAQLANKLTHSIVTQELLEEVSSIKTESELLEWITCLSPTMQEIVLGVAVSDEENSSARAYRPQIFLVSEDIALQHALELSHDLWALFLHPRQEAIVTKAVKARVLIGGFPGTGKTIVLVHRAFLLSKQGEKVLFLTKSRELSVSVKDMLRKLGDQGETTVGTLGGDSKVAKSLLWRTKIQNGRPIRPGDVPLFGVSEKPLHGRQASFTHLIVDEGQDLSVREQEWLTELIDSSDIGISISMDLDQAIHTGNLDRVLSRQSSFELISLEYCYRLTLEMTRFAQQWREKIDVKMVGIPVEEARRVAFISGGSKLVFHGLAGGTVREYEARTLEDLRILLPSILGELALTYAPEAIAILLHSPTYHQNISEACRRSLPNVEILSLKSSKGREWFAGVVIISRIHLNQILSQDTYTINRALKANALYVAFTRFREQLVVITVPD